MVKVQMWSLLDVRRLKNEDVADSTAGDTSQVALEAAKPDGVSLYRELLTFYREGRGFSPDRRKHFLYRECSVRVIVSRFVRHRFLL
jgi:hypothetical protein